jgi:hypothetical protein
MAGNLLCHFQTTGWCKNLTDDVLIFWKRHLMLIGYSNPSMRHYVQNTWTLIQWLKSDTNFLKPASSYINNSQHK